MPQQPPLSTERKEVVHKSDDNFKGTVAVPRRLPRRAIARAVSNLGNTCYMNAVLQALAHAPELCMAMDVNSHRKLCPIYKENAEKMAARSASSSAPSSRSSSPDQTLQNHFDNTEDLKSVYSYSSTGTVRIRKSSRRAARANSPTSNENGEEKSVDDPNATKFCALCEMEHHMYRVHRTEKRRNSNTGSNSGTNASVVNKPVSPTDFVHGFIDHVAPESFRVGQQEDSHEFLRLLIEAMQKSCKQARRSKTGSNQGNPQDTPTESAPSESSSNCDYPSGDQSSTQENIDTEYPFQLFSGKIESKVTCGYCHMTSSTLDPIEDLGLEVTPIAGSALPSIGRRNTPSPVPTSTLADVSLALQRFACAEQLDAGYKCEKCQKVGKATKQMRLASIPPILTLHLKRFRYGSSDPSIANAGSGGPFLGHGNGAYLPTRRSQRSSEVSQLMASSGSNSSVVGNDWFGGKSGSAKIEGPSEFKAVMDLKPYLTDELQQKHGNMLCRLFAVVVHVGKNSHSGHYLAYVRNISKNEWWKMDDSRVSLVSTEEVLSSEAYMLFYRVVDHPYSKKLASQVSALNDAYEKAVTKKIKEEKATVLANNGSLGQRGQEGKVDRKRSPQAYDRSMESESVRKVRSHIKRKKTEFTCGEEWARSKTVITENNIARLRDVEGKISKHITFTPGFEKLLSEHAMTANAKLEQIPETELNLLENCVKDSTEDINIALLRCFLAVSKNDGIVDFTNTPTPTMTTRSTSASRGKIHVVDPSDDLL